MSKSTTGKTRNRPSKSAKSPRINAAESNPPASDLRSLARRYERAAIDVVNLDLESGLTDDQVNATVARLHEPTDALLAAIRARTGDAVGCVVDGHLMLYMPPFCTEQWDAIGGGDFLMIPLRRIAVEDCHSWADRPTSERIYPDPVGVKIEREDGEDRHGHRTALGLIRGGLMGVR